MVRPRPKRGERRIDAAIDQLAQYGFPKPHIRKIINDLLQLYGRDGWMFLEEGSYRVVLEKLLEEQAQLEKKEAAAVDKASSENDMEVSQAVHSEAPAESQSAFEPQAVHSEAPAESQSAVELEPRASANSSCPREPVLPLPLATSANRARLPCHGWISEESETESEPEDGEMLSDIPRPVIFPEKDIQNPVETLPSKRKRRTRWDVRPDWFRG